MSFQRFDSYTLPPSQNAPAAYAFPPVFTQGCGEQHLSLRRLPHVAAVRLMSESEQFARDLQCHAGSEGQRSFTRA
jgi:hypothetical protein